MTDTPYKKKTATYRAPENLGPKALYTCLADKESWQADIAQEAAVLALQALWETLQPAPAPSLLGFFSRFTGVAGFQENEDKQSGVKKSGVYLYGPVGRGKSRLMDLFFESVPIADKRRIHFHAFMAEVHAGLHQLRRVDVNAAARPDPRSGSGEDILMVLAKRLRRDIHVLCLDELSIENVADAMIVARLFTALLEAGIVLVITSNYPPQNLYEGGLQRQRFLPFIDLLIRELTLCNLEQGQDYRQVGKVKIPVYTTPLGPGAKAGLEAAWREMTAGLQEVEEIFYVNGRRLVIPRYCAYLQDSASRDVACPQSDDQSLGLAFMNFAELCARPLGAADYTALAERIGVLFLENIPSMHEAQRNEARRFMTLVDVFYDKGRGLVMTADAPVAQLYKGKSGSFEFRRTLSRLVEMQSAAYFEKALMQIGTLQKISLGR